MTLGGYQVFETEAIEAGAGVVDTLRMEVHLHPLDLIALTATSTDDRMARTIDWILRRGDRLFAAALDRVITPGRSDDLYEIHQAHLRQRGEPQT